MIQRRIIEPAIERALAASPVVVLEGGRAVGKSTVCDLLCDKHNWPSRLDLSDRKTLDLLRLDPERFLRNQPTPCILDEAQLEPNLLLWVKRIVDTRHVNGQFLLTGSARLGRDQLGGSDPLAGRVVRLTMWSMTEREKRSQPSRLMDQLFAPAFSQPKRSVEAESHSSWVGGLPGLSGVLRRATVGQWEREMAAYVEAVLPLSAAGTRADLGRLMRTFRYLASHSGAQVNFARAGSDLGMQANTVKSQLETLEAGFLLFRAEAHRASEQRAVVAHPRVYATDVGLAFWASRAFAGKISAAALGSLAETRVAHDIGALSAAHPERIEVRHWRDKRNRSEVDLLLVHADGRTVPIEVKHSTTVGPADTAGLLSYVSMEPEACDRAVLFYEGERVIDLTPKGCHAKVLAIPRAAI